MKNNNGQSTWVLLAVQAIHSYCTNKILLNGNQIHYWSKSNVSMCVSFSKIPAEFACGALYTKTCKKVKDHLLQLESIFWSMFGAACWVPLEAYFWGVYSSIWELIVVDFADFLDVIVMLSWFLATMKRKNLMSNILHPLVENP